MVSNHRYQALAVLLLLLRFQHIFALTCESSPTEELVPPINPIFWQDANLWKNCDNRYPRETDAALIINNPCLLMINQSMSIARFHLGIPKLIDENTTISGDLQSHILVLEGELKLMPSAIADGDPFGNVIESTGKLVLSGEESKSSILNLNQDTIHVNAGGVVTWTNGAITGPGLIQLSENSLMILDAPTGGEMFNNDADTLSVKKIGATINNAGSMDIKVNTLFEYDKYGSIVNHGLITVMGDLTRSQASTSSLLAAPAIANDVGTIHFQNYRADPLVCDHAINGGRVIVGGSVEFPFSSMGCDLLEAQDGSKLNIINPVALDVLELSVDDGANAYMTDVQQSNINHATIRERAKMVVRTMNATESIVNINNLEIFGDISVVSGSILNIAYLKLNSREATIFADNSSMIQIENLEWTAGTLSGRIYVQNFLSQSSYNDVNFASIDLVIGGSMTLPTNVDLQKSSSFVINEAAEVRTAIDGSHITCYGPERARVINHGEIYGKLSLNNVNLESDGYIGNMKSYAPSVPENNGNETSTEDGEEPTPTKEVMPPAVQQRALNQLELSGNLSLKPSSVLEFLICSEDKSQNSFVSVTGRADLNGTAIIQFEESFVPNKKSIVPMMMFTSKNQVSGQFVHVNFTFPGENYGCKPLLSWRSGKKNDLFQYILAIIFTECKTVHTVGTDWDPYARSSDGLSKKEEILVATLVPIISVLSIAGIVVTIMMVRRRRMAQAVTTTVSVPSTVKAADLPLEDRSYKL